jgi:hypothetical protein
VAVSRRIRRGYLLAWLVLIVVIVVPTLVRVVHRGPTPSVIVVSVAGEARTISLAEMKRLPVLTRPGIYQNQYGNWRDEGVYEGARLADLIGEAADYEAIRVVARDGYEVTIERERVEDPDYPIVLAYAFDGAEVPDWKDGFRIAVLPEGGSVGNEEYGVDSAGSSWVKNVERIILQ